MICSGAYQRPHRPAIAAGFPPDVPSSTRHSTATHLRFLTARCSSSVRARPACNSPRNFSQRAGRCAFLWQSPWIPRRLGDKDIVTWLNRTTFFDQPLPAQGARLVANVQATKGGLSAVSNGRVQFAKATWRDSVAFGDARYLDIRQLLRNTIGSAVPEMPDPPPFEAKAASEVDLDGFGAVVFTSGFRPDYGGWVKFPVFDERRSPSSTTRWRRPYLACISWGPLPTQARRSSLLFGVGEDAAIVARTITKALTASPTSA